MRTMIEVTGGKLEARDIRELAEEFLEDAKELDDTKEYRLKLLVTPRADL